MFIKSNKNRIVKPVVILLIAACLVFAAIIGTRAYGKDMDRRGIATVENAINRASVQCYALEGRYAPSLNYLSENYGVQIDKEKYTVYYIYQGANMAPDIKVFLETGQNVF